MSRAVASRYQPVLVALHWLLALMIIGLLCIGFFVLADMPNTDPKKLGILMLHMAGGMSVFALMILRLIIRIASTRPNTATGVPRLDRLALIAHYCLYLLVFLMIASGYSTGIIAGLNRIVFAHSGEPLPGDFDVFPTFQAHSFLAVLLAILIAVHIAAAFYHQFMLKDGLFRRMWFGKRTITPSEK